jgi:hypothetical protein
MPIETKVRKIGNSLGLVLALGKLLSRLVRMRG